jgi:hypothetical protein
MGELSLLEKVKQALAGLCWEYFLKFSNLTEDEYLTQIENQTVRTQRTKYNELIMAVNQKFANETRHQTALRYIQEAEQLIDIKKHAQNNQKIVQ